jgi:hypothetical protein
MVLEATLSIDGARIRTVPTTVVARRFPNYKYLHLALITISHSFLLSSLRVYSSCLCLPSMEDKRGTKHARSLATEGSPSHSVPTPPLVPSGSSCPLGSSPEVSSRPHARLCFSRRDPLGRFLWWIFLHLQMRKVPLLIPRGMQSSPDDCLATSTATSSGRPMMGR